MSWRPIAQPATRNRSATLFSWFNPLEIRDNAHRAVYGESSVARMERRQHRRRPSVEVSAEHGHDGCCKPRMSVASRTVARTRRTSLAMLTLSSIVELLRSTNLNELAASDQVPVTSEIYATED